MKQIVIHRNQVTIKNNNHNSKNRLIFKISLMIKIHWILIKINLKILIRLMLILRNNLIYIKLKKNKNLKLIRIQSISNLNQI